MREPEIPVTFQPQGKTVYLLEGTRLIEAAAGAGLDLDLPCGGEGICGKCRVIVRRGACKPNAVEQDQFSQSEQDEGFRLACQTSVCGPMTVEVPSTSVLADYHKILAKTEDPTLTVTDPAIRKQYVELTPPTRGSEHPDLARLHQEIGPFDIGLELLRALPGRLRAESFRGTTVSAEGMLIDFERGNTEANCHGIAFDIGTTSLVGMLLDLNSGEQLAVSSRLNPQTGFGDDVLSRIQHASESHNGLGELHEAVIEAIDQMVGELIEQASITRERVYDLSFAGNTTMQHLLCRIDPRYLGEVPFVPATGDRVAIAATKLGLPIHPHGRAYVFPVIGGFVGGDTVAGMLATGMVDADEPTLLIDIGTNGEIVLASDGKLRAASTAAGPAFEGARILHGMRGGTGAIEKVVVSGGRLRNGVIGDVPPVGLCGSALIDLAAELLRYRLMSPEGRMTASDALPDDTPPDLRRRVIAYDGQIAFLLAESSETGTGKPIVLTQRDVRQLQLASGAIRAGITILLKRAGLKPDDLNSVLIAGGFGNFIRRSNAQRIGLLPTEIPRRRIRYQGNTSLAGSRLAAVSIWARQIAERLARRTEHIDLSTDHDFSWAFADAMIFPE